MDRFFLDQNLTTGIHQLPDGEAHHLAKVMRAKPGDRIEVFDGAGTCGPATIREITKKIAKIEVHDIAKEAEPIRKITLAVAAPKGDRLTSLIEKATELGVTNVEFITTARTIVNPRESKLERLQNVVISACKQCRRNHLMRIAGPISWEVFLQTSNYSRKFIADRDGCKISALENWSQNDQTQTVCIAIGPEGGFTTEEIELADNNGFQKVSLGKNILRIETAAIAAAAILAQQ